MEVHFGQCDRCRSVLEGTRNVIQLYGDERMIDVPLGFGHRLQRRLEENIQPSRRRFLGWMVAAAAGVVVAGGFELSRSSVFKHLRICDRHRRSVDAIAGNHHGNAARRQHKPRHGDQLRRQIPLHSGFRDWLGGHFRYQRGRIAYHFGGCRRPLRCCWIQWHSGKLVATRASCHNRSSLVLSPTSRRLVQRSYL